MANGTPVTLYHGTTADFTEFKDRSRKELVDQYYGGGLFFTPDKKVAWKYAYADRNMPLPKTVIKDIARANPKAGLALALMFKHGREDTWDILAKQFGTQDFTEMQAAIGANLNDLMDLSKYIPGSRVKLFEDDTPDDLSVLMGGGGIRPPFYSTLDDLGVDSRKYRPKVYTVKVKTTNPLVTDSQSKARSAKSKGYDSVVYYGPQTVSGIAEVAVFNPNAVSIVGVEVDTD